MLSPQELDTAAAGTSIIYYLVDDIAAAHALLTQRGVSFDEPPHVIARMPDHDLWMTVCKDSEGNHVGLMSEVRR
jgi:methylmalonyl-CoA/ethylmalonyl-CoA epimerase